MDLSFRLSFRVYSCLKVNKDLPEEQIKIQTFLLWLNIFSHQTHLSPIDTFVDLTPPPPHCSISSSSKQKAPHFMALRCFPIWVCPQTPHRYPLVGRRVSLWECSSSSSGASQRAVTAVEGDGPELKKKASDEMGLVREAKPVAFHRDLSMLPSESTRSFYLLVSLTCCCFMVFTLIMLIGCFVFMQSCILRLWLLDGFCFCGILLFKQMRDHCW